MSNSFAFALHDVALASLCAGGDRHAQRALFERHRPRVHATLFRVLGSNTQMAHLIQEAFLNVFSSLQSFRGDASLAAWIDRCTVRVAYAFLTVRRIRPPSLELVVDPPSGAPSAEQRVVREATRRLYAELEKLEPSQRLAFTLHAIDGRPIDEVAELMDSSVVATKARVWRARLPFSPVVVEPLSMHCWGKIERGLFAELDHARVVEARASYLPHPSIQSEYGRTRPVAALVVAGAVAAVFGGFAGRALFARPAIAPASIVTEAREAHVTVGEAMLDVAPSSSVAVSGDDERGVAVVLDRGGVRCAIAPRRGRPPFVVHAGDVRVRAIGTRFTVARDETGARVDVTEGTVEVSMRGSTLSVHAGESWPSRLAPVAPDPREAPAAPEPPIPFYEADAPDAVDPPNPMRMVVATPADLGEPQRLPAPTPLVAAPTPLAPIKARPVGPVRLTPEDARAMLGR